MLAPGRDRCQESSLPGKRLTREVSCGAVLLPVVTDPLVMGRDTGSQGVSCSPPQPPIIQRVDKSFQGLISPKRRPWLRRNPLTCCFLKITLPLSAGRGCSTLNNHSRSALPCSEQFAQGCHSREAAHIITVNVPDERAGVLLTRVHGPLGTAASPGGLGGPNVSLRTPPSSPI